MAEAIVLIVPVQMHMQLCLIRAYNALTDHLFLLFKVKPHL